MSTPRKSSAPRPSLSPERPQSSRSAKSSSSGGSSVDSKDPNVTVKKAGLKREYAEKNEKDWTRTINADGTKTEWKKVDKVAEPTTTCQLHLARQKQALNEPLHWSLIVCNAEGQQGEQRFGRVYQVKGDALNMQYRYYERVNVLESSSLYDHFVLASNFTEAQERELGKIAYEEPPPHASNMQELTENCQGWTLRVLAQCVEKKVVPAAALAKCKKVQQPIRK